ncbi:hypothetical protein E1091_09235 [Micromonospora fluostatini]|uniref:Nuclear transport factor 2 family protein n=1 Tax=Micromonospora fluostatini TaxID=1629071 RepID=A0ABY2DJW6_9ACTN|nr:hypothetical protein E1091_09235 [Micromonospora fluostatini]
MTLGEAAQSIRPRRRWPMVAAAACAVLATLAAVVVCRVQAHAERGEPAPEAAATVWMLQLSAGERLGVSRVLAPDRHDELRQQWQEYRTAMESTGRPPFKLETVGRLVVDDRAEDRALVVAQVRGIWWDGPTVMAGTAHPWRWETRRDAGGWRVWSTELPPWCGTHVRAELCEERPR